MQGDGLAIIDAGINFGGGILGKYGINSNTSGGGFLKCTYKKIKKHEKTEKNNEKEIINPTQEGSAQQNKKSKKITAQNKG